jgi:hypothetical protein
MAREVLPTDLPAIASWHNAHGAAPDLGLLPPTGVVEPGVAAGFLFLAGPVAFLDGYVTNPSAPLRARSQAIDAITKALLIAAKAAGARRVLGLCESPGIIRRAAKYGLRPMSGCAVRGDL